MTTPDQDAIRLAHHYLSPHASPLQNMGDIERMATALISFQAQAAALREALELALGSLPAPDDHGQEAKRRIKNTLSSTTLGADLLEEMRGLRAQITQITNERDGEREARERCSDALRQKDQAMGVLFQRLDKAGVDCSDLIS